MTTNDTLYMIRLDLISGESRKWREFFSAIESGDKCTFPVEDFKTVETIRAAAYQFNLREQREYRLTVSAKPSETPILVTIATEMRDGVEIH